MQPQIVKQRKINNKRTSHPKSPTQKRLARQKSAQARRTEYDKLSTQEKLDKLPINGAIKQRTRLLSLLKRENKKTKK